MNSCRLAPSPRTAPPTLLAEAEALPTRPGQGAAAHPMRGYREPLSLFPDAGPSPAGPPKKTVHEVVLDLVLLLLGKLGGILFWILLLLVVLIVLLISCHFQHFLSLPNWLPISSASLMNSCRLAPPPKLGRPTSRRPSPPPPLSLFRSSDGDSAPSPRATPPPPPRNDLDCSLSAASLSAASPALSRSALACTAW